MQHAAVVDRPVRMGVVSFVNTLPWIDGLERLRDVELRPSVPSLLLDQLERGDVDLALCSSIDYQRSRVPLAIVPIGGLGCDGPTLTVRLYSRRPLETLDEVHADTDSHTSIALMQILFAEQLGRTLRIVPYDAREHVARNRPVEWPDAVLLIGDKVVTDSPPAVRYPHQLDLGEAWRQLTGLPFVFALWLVRADDPPARLAMAASVLDRQRRANAARLATIIHDRAEPRGWPRDLAEDYLGHRIRYAWSDRAARGLETFFARAEAHGLIDRCRPVVHLAS